jgi:hypothetical protein
VSDEAGVADEGWDGSFEANAVRQQHSWAEETTPEQRLAWLEEAIAFAHDAGAAPEHRPSEQPAETRDRDQPGR